MMLKIICQLKIAANLTWEFVGKTFKMVTKVRFNPNVTREVIRYENFVVIIPVLIK
jgi:hypothetical protein